MADVEVQVAERIRLRDPATRMFLKNRAQQHVDSLNQWCATIERLRAQLVEAERKRDYAHELATETAKLAGGTFAMYSDGLYKLRV